MNNQTYTNRTSDVTLSNTAVLLQQEMTFLVASRTQSTKGHHRAQLCKKKFLVVLSGVGFVLSVFHYGCK